MEEKIICETVGDVMSFFQMFNINCPITPVELTYVFDFKTEAKINIKIKEATDEKG